MLLGEAGKLAEIQLEQFAPGYLAGQNVTSTERDIDAVVFSVKINARLRPSPPGLNDKTTPSPPATSLERGPRTGTGTPTVSRPIGFAGNRQEVQWKCAP